MLSGPSLHGTLVAAPVQRGFARTGAHFVRPRGGSCATNAACRLRASRATHPPSKHTTNLIRELKILHLGSAFNFRIKNMQKSSRYHGPTTMHTYDRQALLDPLPTVLSGRILASVSPIPHPFPNHPCSPSALTLRRKRTKGAQQK